MLGKASKGRIISMQKYQNSRFRSIGKCKEAIRLNSDPKSIIARCALCINRSGYSKLLVEFLLSQRLSQLSRNATALPAFYGYGGFGGDAFELSAMSCFTITGVTEDHPIFVQKVFVLILPFLLNSSKAHT